MAAVEGWVTTQSTIRQKTTAELETMPAEFDNSQAVKKIQSELMYIKVNSG